MSIDQYSWKCNALLNSTCIENIGTDFTWNLSTCNLWDHWMTSLWDLLTVYTRDLLAMTMFDLIVCLCPQVKFYLESPTSALHRSHVLLPSLTQVHMTCYLHLLISQQTKELINKQTNKLQNFLCYKQFEWDYIYNKPQHYNQLLQLTFSIFLLRWCLTIRLRRQVLCVCISVMTCRCCLTFCVDGDVSLIVLWEEFFYHCNGHIHIHRMWWHDFISRMWTT